MINATCWNQFFWGAKSTRRPLDPQEMIFPVFATLCALAAVPATAIWRSTKTDAKAVVPPVVRAGEDRLAKARQTPTGTSAFKVGTRDTAGAMFVMEHRNIRKGGPALHLHHYEDELFYVIEGGYILQIGSEQHRLKAGDCILGPRLVPHTWAFVGETPGRLLIAYAPAGKMEAFFVENRDRRGGGYTNDADIMRAYGMELLGPPIEIE